MGCTLDLRRTDNLVMSSLTEASCDDMIRTEDKVHHPSHYTTGTIEVIDYIRDKLSPRDFTSYCQGNVMKYVSRWREKGGVEDLEKAKVYLDWMIESAKKEEQS